MADARAVARRLLREDAPEPGTFHIHHGSMEHFEIRWRCRRCRQALCARCEEEGHRCGAGGRPIAFVNTGNGRWT